MLEKTIESKLVKLVAERGGMCLKFVSPGRAGVPDRIVIVPGGRVIFVELKTDGWRLSPVQEFQHKQLRRLGADVRTLYGAAAVRAFVEEVFPDAV